MGRASGSPELSVQLFCEARAQGTRFLRADIQRVARPKSCPGAVREPLLLQPLPFPAVYIGQPITEVWSRNAAALARSTPKTPYLHRQHMRLLLSLSWDWAESPSGRAEWDFATPSVASLSAVLSDMGAHPTEPQFVQLRQAPPKAGPARGDTDGAGRFSLRAGSTSTGAASSQTPSQGIPE